MLQEREIGRDQPIKSPLGMTPPGTRLPGDDSQGKDQWEQETNDLKQISAPGFIAKGVKSRRYSWQFPSSFSTWQSCQEGGCEHSTTLGAARCSQIQPNGSDMSGLEERAVIEHHGHRQESTVRVKCKTWPLCLQRG